MLSTLLKLIGCIAVLMYGMKVMSEALQKMAGPGLRHILGAMTSNRFMGVMTGMLVCVAVQSSAATTVMTVSFVNAALLTLAQAISVIMGANIGTTLSAWIMSAGFSFNITAVVWPAFLVAIILIQFKKYRYMGDFLFGLSFLFFALGTLSATGQELNLAGNQKVVDFFAGFDSASYLTILLFLLIGAVLTCIAQSSAALMAITMVLCTTGVITIYQGIALVMGENIGTTLTANLAAMSANTQARRAALAHLLFNVIGVIWVLCVFYPFVNLACKIVGVDPAAETVQAAKLSFVLATFHTMFNVTNTAILIWFIPQLEKIVSKLIPQKEEEPTFRLQYIQSGIIKTPEISVYLSQKETELFAGRTKQMFSLVRELYNTTDEEAFQKLRERITAYEEAADHTENEIGTYLGQVSNSHLSDDTKQKIRAMIRMVSEIESIADSCFNFTRTLERKHRDKVVFTPEQEEGLAKMAELVDQALDAMILVIQGEQDSARSFEIEQSINALRDKLRSANAADIDEGKYSFTTGTIYMDLVGESEKCADYIVNVVENKTGVDAPSSHPETILATSLA